MAVISVQPIVRYENYISNYTGNELEVGQVGTTVLL